MPIQVEQTPDIVRNSLEASDAQGFLSATIFQVTDEMSEGGRHVTATEQRMVNGSGRGKQGGTVGSVKAAKVERRVSA
jgi:hypothetical protein